MFFSKEKKKKKDWILVCHTYHVSSYGFDEKLLFDLTEKEAKLEAAMFAEEHRGTCRSADAVAIPLPDTVVVIKR